MPRKHTVPVDSAPGSALGKRVASESNPAHFIEDQIASASANTERCLDDIAAYTQRHPHQALLSAMAAGYALRVLPAARILGGLIRLGLIILKPAALVYGVAKLWSSLQNRAVPHSTQEVY